MDNNRHFIRLRVEDDKHDRLKLTWGNPRGDFEHYFVFRENVEGAARQARQTLTHLVEAALDGRTSSFGAILRKLAKDGDFLHQQLFEDIAPGGPEDPQNITSWLNELEGEISLTISLSSSIYVPWGLVYSGDSSKLDDETINVDHEVYNSFWARRFGVSCMFSTKICGGLRSRGRARLSRSYR
jgi:hypothetical protein